MIRAHIKSPENSNIGTINEENGSFRIWWRKRMETQPGNVHSAESKVYTTFEEARQAVYREDKDLQIVEAKV